MSGSPPPFTLSPPSRYLSRVKNRLVQSLGCHFSHILVLRCHSVRCHLDVIFVLCLLVDDILVLPCLLVDTRVHIFVLADDVFSSLIFCLMPS